MSEGAHHLEEGCPRVKSIGLLVPQHQVVSSIDDDLLQANQGPQQPVVSRRERWSRGSQLSAAPAGPALSCSLPTNHAHILSLKWGGTWGWLLPDPIVYYHRLLGSSGDGIVVLEEPQRAASFRQKSKIRQRVLASQSRAAGMSHSQAV